MRIGITIIFLFLWPIAFTAYSATRDDSSNSKRLRNYSTIEEINKEKYAFGTYYIEGYVSKMYTCPPCPRGLNCSLCMQDNIVVSSKKKFLNEYDLTDQDLIIFVDDIEQFELGKKYLILITILDVKTTLQPINNIKLIYHKRLGE